MPGFPIRTSSDPRSVGSSPRHIAASHVLHRLSVPRHPPCALKHLQHKTKKMSHHPHTPRKAHASIRKICITYQTHTPTRGMYLDARNHYPQIKHHTPPPKQGNNKNPEPPKKSGSARPAPTPPTRNRPAGLLSQSPIVCLAARPPQHPVEKSAQVCLSRTRPPPTTGEKAIQRIAQKTR